MATFRIYIEETSTRLLYTDVDAKDEDDATEQAEAAIESGAWVDWAESDSHCSLEVCDHLTEPHSDKAVR